MEHLVEATSRRLTAPRSASPWPNDSAPGEISLEEEGNVRSCRLGCALLSDEESHLGVLRLHGGVRLPSSLRGRGQHID